MKSFVFILFASLLFTISISAQIYIVPNGGDTNSDTFEQPLEPIQQAQSMVSAGDKVYIRGGFCQVRENQISSYLGNGLIACISYLNKSGTATQTIKYWVYPSEQVTSGIYFYRLKIFSS